MKVWLAHRLMDVSGWLADISIRLLGENPDAEQALWEEYREDLHDELFPGVVTPEARAMMVEEQARRVVEAQDPLPPVPLEGSVEARIRAARSLR